MPAPVPPEPPAIRSLLRCWRLLDRRTRCGWCLLVPLGVIATLLDLATACLLLRMVGMAGGEKEAAGGRLGGWLDALPATIGWLLVLIVAVIGTKTLLRLYETYRRETLAERTVTRLAHHALEHWLHAPLREHLSASAPQVVEEIQSSAHSVGRDGIASGMILLSEGMIVLALGGLLAVVAPLPAAFFLALLGALAGLILHLAHRRHARWGEAQVLARPALLGFVQSMVAGVREIRIGGAAGLFLERFDSLRAALGGPQARIDTWRQAPLFLLEALFIVGACLLLWLLQHDAGLPLLVMALYAALRMLPAVNRLIYRLFALQNSLAAARRLAARPAPARDLRPPPASPAPEFREAIVLDRVRFAYPGGTRPVLDGVDLTLRRGERLAVVGPSGHGKSTLLLVLAGLAEPDEGAVRVDGRPLAPDDPRWHRLVGFVGQDAPLIDDTLAANIALGVAPDRVDRAALDAAVSAAQLGEVVGRLPLGLLTPLGPNGRALSGGERQRVALARALYRRPRLLLLDEATAFLDQPVEQAVLAALDALGPELTVVFVTHRLAAARQAGRIAFFRDGRIEAAASPDALLAAHPAFAAFASASTDRSRSATAPSA